MGKKKKISTTSFDKKDIVYGFHPLDVQQQPVGIYTSNNSGGLFSAPNPPSNTSIPDNSSVSDNG